MNSEDSFWDPASFNLSGSFDEQVDKLFMNIRLTKYEVENLYTLQQDLESCLQSIWADCTVRLFGSIITGLGIQSSDVDCYVELPNYAKANGNNFVIVARNVLRRQPMFSDVFAIPKAKVPIVKFYHIHTGRNCDVSFKSPSGVMNSKLIKTLLHMDKRALYLAIIIKYWGKIHKLTGTNFMPNYALTLLVIFYLQGKLILPSVFELQRQGRSYYVDNWNVDFSDIEYMSDNDDTLYSLVGGFFQYYSKFNYKENIVSPFLGIPLNKKLFQNLSDVPDILTLYKDNVANGVCQSIKLDSMICVQDPFEHSRNCSVGVHLKLATRIINEFECAAEKFRLNKKSDFLKSILIVSQQESQVVSKKVRKNLSRVMKHKDLNGTKTNLNQNIRHHFQTAQNQYRWRRRW